MKKKIHRCRFSLMICCLCFLPLSCERSNSSSNLQDGGIGLDYVLIDSSYVPGCRPIVANPTVVEAVGCSHAEVSQAVSEVEAAGGGTVCLPACTSEWWEEEIALPGGIGFMGQGAGMTVLRSVAYRFFNINERGDQAGPFRISGITFDGYHSGSDHTVQNIISFNNIQDFRIDHCHLRGCRYCITANSRLEYPPSTGVVDHCIIEKGQSTYESVYCVSVGPRLWLEEMGLGTSDAVFIEDNILVECGHPAATFGGGHYVFRYNTVIDSSSLDGHGPGFESTGRGTRCIEVHNNHFYHNVDPHGDNRGWTAIGLRAGGGVIFDNIFEHYSYGVRFTIETGVAGRLRGPSCTGCAEADCFAEGDVCFAGDPDCYRYDVGAYACTGCEDCHALHIPFDYPALDQVHDMWVWNNNHLDVSHDDEIMLYANDAENMIVEDRDYFRRAPDQTRDGFDYVPYTYPHPLVID